MRTRESAPMAAGVLTVAGRPFPGCATCSTTFTRKFGRLPPGALGQMGHSEARALLAHCLREAPSAEVIDAIAAIADEGCIILLGRVARTVPSLTEPVLDALDAIDHPRAVKIAADVRTSWPG